jgi:hypothetical protein
MRVKLVSGPEPIYCYDRGYVVSVKSTSCTTLDHIYPSNRNVRGGMKPNTRCYCGARRWGGTGEKFEPVSRATENVLVVRIKRGNAESSATEESVMKAKKSSAKKTTAKSESKSRAWNQTYEFVKPLKVEPPKDTIRGCVYAGVKSVKNGNADEVCAAAVKAGLADVTGQDPRTQTMVHLRNLIADGAVKVHRDTGTAEVKVATKKVVAKKSLKVKLQKAS